MDKPIEMPSMLKGFFIEVGGITEFIKKFFTTLIKAPFEWNEMTKQFLLIGYKSLPLVSITGFIMGLVMTIQSRPTLAIFGAESLLPPMVGISLVREIVPVITALICAGKIGSGIGAELASMKVTEQIDAMEVSGINPFKFIVVTRVLATTLMIPLLVLYADFIGFIGGFAGINIKGHVTFQLFMNLIFDHMEFLDLLPALAKTFFFGFAIGIIACYKGYNCDKGTEGVGLSANSSVVLGSLLVFIIDMIAVQITSLFM